MRLTPLLLTAMLAAVSGALAAEMPNNWGYDIRGGNQTTGPGDDFNTFANGAFLDSLTIPPDRSSYGVDEILSDRVENQIKELLESNAPTVPDAVKTHVLYQAFMDQQRVDAAGATPLAFDLAAVNQARTRLELAALMGTSVRSFQASLFDLSIEADAKSTAHYTVVVSQSDLGLPDRDYYLQAQFADQKMKYGEYIAQILALVGWPDATIQAANILAYETRLADASWPREQERDPNKIYNPTTTADLVAAAPGFCWQAFLKAAGLGSLPRLVIQESTALPRLAAIYRGTPVETLRAWAAFHLMDHAAPELAKPFVDANFAFHNGVLSGQPQQLPRWKRGVALVNTIVGDAVGRAYVAAYVPPEAKARVVALVADLRAAFAARIQQVDWMSPETRGKSCSEAVPACSEGWLSRQVARLFQTRRAGR